MRICSHLLNKILTKKFIFCALICASRQNTTVKLKITYVQKKYVTSLFTFSEKSLQFSNFLPLGVQLQKVLRPFVFYLSEIQSTVLVSSSLQGENVLIQQLFLIKEGKKLLRYFCKSQKLCLHKIFKIGSTTKVNSREFCVTILDVKCTKLQYC